MQQKRVTSPVNLAVVQWWSLSIYQARETNEQVKIDRTIVILLGPFLIEAVRLVHDALTKIDKKSTNKPLVTRHGLNQQQPKFASDRNLTSADCSPIQM